MSCFSHSCSVSSFCCRRLSLGATQEPARAGCLDPEAAEALGVPKGKDFARLKAGEAVMVGDTHRSLKCHIAICPVCTIVFKYCLHLSIKRVSSKDYRQDR